MVLNVCKVSTKGFCNLIFLQRLEEARYSVSCWNLAGSHAALPFPVIHPQPPALLITWLYLPYISPVKLLRGYRREKEENQLRYKPAWVPACLSPFPRLSWLCYCTPSCQSEAEASFPAPGGQAEVCFPNEEAVQKFFCTQSSQPCTNTKLQHRERI